MIRQSLPRTIILEELRKLKTHPRGDELYQLVRRRLPRVSLGTVYRNLDLLRRYREVLELFCGDFNRYDADTSPHHHFLCQNCKRMWDFDAALPSAERVVADNSEGFQVEGYYAIFYGLCAECRQAS